MGCGKSTLGRKVAKCLGVQFVDTDRYIEHMEGMKISEIFATKGEAYFRQKETEVCEKFSNETGYIIATGGGAKSPIWCQMYADITGLPVRIPAEKEAACLGAAMIAAVSDGRFADYAAAADHCVALLHRYEPNPTAHTEKKYRRFCALYRAALEINSIN